MEKDPPYQKAGYGPVQTSNFINFKRIFIPDVVVLMPRHWSIFWFRASSSLQTSHGGDVGGDDVTLTRDVGSDEVTLCADVT